MINHNSESIMKKISFLMYLTFALLGAALLFRFAFGEKEQAAILIIVAFISMVIEGYYAIFKMKKKVPK